MFKKIFGPREDVKIRYDLSQREVAVVENEAWRKRLEEMREFSRELNLTVQSKFESAGLPFYTRRANSGLNSNTDISSPKVLRLAFMIRPEFFSSTEQKDRSTRYNTQDDQITFFFHITKDGKLQMIRTHRGFSSAAFGIYFIAEAFPNITLPENETEKNYLEKLIREKNIELFSDYILSRFSSGHMTDFGFMGEQSKTYTRKATEQFCAAYSIQSVDEAKKYFSQKDIFMYQPKEVIRNVGKIVLATLLQEGANNFDHGVDSSVTVSQLYGIADSVLDIDIAYYPKPQKLSFFVPHAREFVATIIKNTSKKIKKKKFNTSK